MKVDIDIEGSGWAILCIIICLLVCFGLGIFVGWSIYS